MKRLAAALIPGLALAGAAAAAPPVKVELSGHTYHVAVCPGPAAPGSARCHAHVVTDRNGMPIARAPAPNTMPSGYGPTALRSAYGVTGTGAPTTVIAIVDAYGYTNAFSDMNTYRSTFGIPQLPACGPNFNAKTITTACFAKFNQNGVQGSYPRQNTGWSQETALDLDMASAMCPSCTIILVEANTASYTNLGTAVNQAANLGAHVISNSYGGGESGTLSYDGYYNHPGVAVTVSSGDSGYGVQFPASSEFVTAVGGTSLKAASNSRGWNETVWSGAGSGCSAMYKQQPWQTPFTTVCGVYRAEADVSAVADPATGVAVFAPTNGGGSVWQVFGGTSVAAPLVGGIYGVNGGAVTYSQQPYTAPSSVYPVYSGNNGSCGAPLCTATSGNLWNGPTGIGTPNGVSSF